MTRAVPLLLLSLAAATAAPAPLLCEPGETYFSDSFSDPRTSAERWFFREFWTVADGTLTRSKLPAANQRVFIRKPSFKNCTITLDFAFDGAGEIRVMTGASGPYNAVVTIWPHGFRVFTAKDDSGPFLPTPHGERALDLERGTMHSLSLEFFGDELVVQLGGEAIIARHPIIDKTRTYFAFQVDRPAARFDKVVITHAESRKPGWAETRATLMKAGTTGEWLPKDEAELRRDLEMITRDRLFRSDPKYRKLVDAIAEAKSAEKEAYPEVFKSLKERKKAIAEERDRLLAEDPGFKPARDAIHVARRAEDSYLRIKHPELGELSAAAAPLALAERRVQAEQGDPEFAKLLAATREHERVFAERYPQIHISEEALQHRGREARQAVNADPVFKTLIKTTSLAVRAEKEYIYAAEPKLRALTSP